MENGSKLLINTSILYRSMQKFYDKRLSKYDIGSGQLPLLLLIYEHEGISMQELAKMGAFDKGTITRGLVKLDISALKPTRRISGFANYIHAKKLRISSLRPI